MAKDGRLTIRFKDLLPAIEEEAKAVDRDAGEWVRIQMRIVIEKRRRKRSQRQIAVVGNQ